MIIFLASVLSAPVNLPAPALTIVLIIIAAFVGGVIRYAGGKAKLPDWASFACALFAFGLLLAVFGLI